MNIDNEDRRVIRTKAAIRRTFEQMIVDMDYQKITIKELAQRAGINRKTFYLHYTSLEELFNELQSELVQRLTEVVEDATTDKDASRLKQYLICFHNLVMENPLLHKKLMFNTSYDFIFSNVNSTLMNKWLLELFPKSTESEELSLIFEITCSVIFTAYKSWFYHDSKLPVERLIAIIENQLQYGLSGMKNIQLNII